MTSLRDLVPTPLRLLAALLLPLPSRRSSPNVSDISSLALGEDIHIDVYWLAAPPGPGPAASLVACGEEVMRFDCVGEGRGHMHLNLKRNRGFPGETARIYFSEQKFEEQIARSCFELEHNVDYALKTNVARRIRRLDFDADARQQASAFMRQTMLDLLDQHGAGPGTSSSSAPAVGKPAPQPAETRSESG